MARGVDHIDLDTFVVNRNVLRENGDSAFPFELVAVQDLLLRKLPVAKLTALFEHAVDERRFAMVDVSNDDDISYVGTLHFRSAKELGIA